MPFTSWGERAVAARPPDPAASRLPRDASRAAPNVSPRSTMLRDMGADAIPSEPQAAPAVLMIRPAHFAANPETAGSNYFQLATGGDADVAARAAREFDGLATALAAAGIRVYAFAGRRDERLPDEVFPNNWLSLHADGTAVLYPMQASSRRRERRTDVLDALRTVHGYRITRVVDLTELEARGAFLEGTGSVVLDRTNRVAYACRSPRTRPDALAAFARELGYDTLSFDALDARGRAIYHTNVLLSIGTRFAALCTAALAAADRRRVLERLEASGRTVVDLSFAQLEAFAGNLLELRGGGASVIALSSTALGSLSAAPRRVLEASGQLLAADVATIEAYGGGSVRCMLAEIALPRARPELTP
jgi:hypothetical protein